MTVVIPHDHHNDVIVITVMTTISLPHEVDKASLICNCSLNPVSKTNCCLSLLLVHWWQVPDITDNGPACHHQVQVLHHWVATAVPESITKLGIILQTGKHDSSASMGVRFPMNQRHIRKHSYNDKVSHPRRPEFSITLLWELQNLQRKIYTPNQDATRDTPLSFPSWYLAMIIFKTMKVPSQYLKKDYKTNINCKIFNLHIPLCCINIQYYIYI